MNEGIKIEISSYDIAKENYRGWYNADNKNPRRIQLGPYTILSTIPGVGIEENVLRQFLEGKVPDTIEGYEDANGVVGPDGTALLMNGGDMFTSMINAMLTR